MSDHPFSANVRQDGKERFALTGANGQLGRLTLAHLMKLVPADQIVATSRSPESLSEFASRGVVLREADFNKPETLTKAFAGATRLLVISTDAMTGEGRFAHSRTAIEAAVDAGIRHITFTSSPNAAADSDHPFIRSAGLIEALLADSAPAWTALRNNVYMEGVAYFLDALRDGRTIFIPEGEAKPAWIAREDCARAAAWVLAGRSAISGAVELTGPEALGFADLARRWAVLNGQELAVEVLPDAELADRLAAKGMQRPMAEGIAGQAAWLSRQPGTAATGVVEEATGVKPRSVDSLLRALALSDR
jgi:NAD(P)H dehydrogenase (quinone)